MPYSCPNSMVGGLHFHVMLCGRGLGATHIHRPITTYVLGAKVQIIIETSKYYPSFLFINGRG